MVEKHLAHSVNLPTSSLQKDRLLSQFTCVISYIQYSFFGQFLQWPVNKCHDLQFLIELQVFKNLFGWHIKKCKIFEISLVIIYKELLIM